MGNHRTVKNVKHMLQIGTCREYLSHTSIPIYMGSRITMMEDLTLVRPPWVWTPLLLRTLTFSVLAAGQSRNFIYNSPKKGFLVVLQMVYISKMFMCGRSLPYYLWHQLLRNNGRKLRVPSSPSNLSVKEIKEHYLCNF